MFRYSFLCMSVSIFSANFATCNIIQKTTWQAQANDKKRSNRYSPIVSISTIYQLICWLLLHTSNQQVWLSLSSEHELIFQKCTSFACCTLNVHCVLNQLCSSLCTQSEQNLRHFCVLDDQNAHIPRAIKTWVHEVGVLVPSKRRLRISICFTLESYFGSFLHS